jgi:hypothetical protein
MVGRADGASVVASDRSPDGPDRRGDYGAR